MKYGYARVSTAQQDLKLQVDALEQAGCDEIITEVMTGSSSDRPARQALLDKLLPGDSLVVWRLDRFGRSVSDLIEKVDQFSSSGVNFQSLNEQIDTSSSVGKMIFHIFAAMAEFERDLISERTKAGLAAARARGRKGGRKKLLDESKVKAAKKLIESETPVTEVAKLLNVSRATLYRYLNE